MVDDVLVMCLQSFLRVKLRRGMPVMDNSGAPGRQEHNNLLLKEVMAASLEVFRAYVEFFFVATFGPFLKSTVSCLALFPGSRKAREGSLVTSLGVYVAFFLLHSGLF